MKFLFFLMSCRLALNFRIKHSHFRKLSCLYSSENSMYTVVDITKTLDVVKNSKFHVTLSPSSNIEDAMTFIKSISDSKASHNCWAFKSSTGYVRCYDDGEPSGTAGKPILNAIESAKLVDCVILVTRYFGGVKLGTGGLSRAYGNAARICIDKANKIEYLPRITFQYSYPISYHNNILNIIKSIPNIIKISEIFNNNKVIVNISIPKKDLNILEDKIENINKGQISITSIES